VPEREVLILAADDIGIESADGLKVISRDRHICRSTEIRNLCRPFVFRNAVPLEHLPETDEWCRRLLLRKDHRPHNKASRPALMCIQVPLEKVATHRNVIVDEYDDLAARGRRTGIARSRPFATATSDNSESSARFVLAQYDRRNGPIVYNHDFKS